MKTKKTPWEVWNDNAKKSKARVLRQLCSNCRRPLSEGGVSAYPGLCKQCMNSKN